ncbi:ankyrin repeat domain-containing protein, partial [Legionella pneumophila]
QHKADELLSLPIAKREYSKCSEGTLYIPEDVVEKLHGILQSATGSNELLSAFESELSVVISALEKGIGTGEAIDGEEDEFIPKRFENAKLQLTAAIDALVGMKQEMDTSKDATVEDQLPKLKS